MVRNWHLLNSMGANEDVLHLLLEIRRELNALKVTQRYMVKGLEREFLFEQEYGEYVACMDEVDQAILVELYHAGYAGVLPKDIADALKDYELNRFQVLRRIQHMNKLLEERTKKQVAEKHGHRWALTEFTHEAYDKTKEELSQRDEEKESV